MDFLSLLRIKAILLTNHFNKQITSINKSLVKNKSLILIDDSLVRGTTSVKIIKMLYESGAKEVHLRVASPPIKYPDYYGVDTPKENELLAENKKNINEMAKHIGVKTLSFLSQKS